MTRHVCIRLAKLPPRSMSLRQSLPGGVTVDREAGVIRNVAVITAGETLTDSLGNPPVLVDAVTLQQVAKAINTASNGIKSRLTHPEVEGDDGITRLVGSVRNARIAGNRVLADVHIGRYAANSPSGDLRSYLLDLAEDSPESAGLSLVSTQVSLESTKEGTAMRLAGIDAVDWVGTPAANPRGLLSASKHNSGRTSSAAQNAKEKTMKLTPEQLAYLQSLGMEEGAEEDAVAEFIASLDEDQAAELARIGAEGAAAAAEEDEGGEAAAAAGKSSDGKAASSVAGDAAGAAVAAAVAAAEGEEDKYAAAAASAPVVDRLSRIIALAGACGLSAKWAASQAKSGKSIEHIRKMALAQRRKTHQPVAMSSVTGGENRNTATLGAAVADAICLRAGVPLLTVDQYTGRVALGADGKPQHRKPHERAMQFSQLSILDMFRRYMMSLGAKNMDFASRSDLTALMLSRSRLQSALGSVYLAHATGDFPALLADVLNKSLRAQYALAQPLWQRWTTRRVATDFKPLRSLQLSEAANLQSMQEGEEYSYATLAESQEVYRIGKYGMGFQYTREMAINDDLDAFSRLPSLHARAASRLEEKIALDALVTNPVMADGQQLFSSAHGNLAGTGVAGAPSPEAFSAAIAAFRKQTAFGSDDPLDIQPSFILAPASLEYKIRTLLNSAYTPGATNETSNIYQGIFEPLITARLDAIDDDAWYLLANPSDIPTVEVAFLSGEESPQILEEEEFNNDVLKLKVRHYLGAKALDFRGVYKNPGA